MKICIVTHELSLTDGQGYVNYQIANYLLAQGHQLVFVASTVANELANHPNAVFFPISLPRWLKGALFQNQVFAWKSRKVLQEHRSDIDIIHLNGSITYHASDVNTAHFVHSHWIQSQFHPVRSLRGPNRYYQYLYTWINSVWEKKTYQEASAVVAVSDTVKQSLVNNCKTEADKISVLPNGVDLQRFQPIGPGEHNLLKDVVDVENNTFLGFFVGDLKSNRKNLDLVLNALVQLPQTVHLAIAGSTHQSPYPELANSLGLQDRVHFVGHRSDVDELMRGADVFLFPSHYETFGLVVLEALASGVPVVTSPTVGSSTLIKPGENGFLVDSHDLAGVVESMQLLLGDADKREAMAIAARRSAESHSWNAMAESYEKLYLYVFQAKHHF